MADDRAAGSAGPSAEVRPLWELLQFYPQHSLGRARKRTERRSRVSARAVLPPKLQNGEGSRLSTAHLPREDALPPLKALSTPVAESDVPEFGRDVSTRSLIPLSSVLRLPSA